MKNKLRHKCEQHPRYDMRILNKYSRFDILNDIREKFPSAELMESLVNVNHDISIVGYWIFDSNYEQSLHLIRESLDLSCSPFVGEEKVVKSETVFFTVRYMWAPVDWS